MSFQYPLLLFFNTTARRILESLTIACTSSSSSPCTPRPVLWPSGCQCLGHVALEVWRCPSGRALQGSFWGDNEGNAHPRDNSSLYKLGPFHSVAKESNKSFILKPQMVVLAAV